jgi:hypothetical protein
VKIFAGCGGIDVEVGDGFLLQLAGKIFAPLRGTGERVFFAIPIAKYQGPSRADSLLEEFTHVPGHLE